MAENNVNSYVLPTHPDGYRGALVGLGWGSVRRWAIAHGFHSRTVHSVLERWAHRADEPNGEEARKIMVALRLTLSGKRRPKKARRSRETPVSHPAN